MTSTADRYRRLSNDMAATIAGVPAPRWDDPSPCDGWSARRLVAHLVETQAMFLGFVGRSLGEGPDPLHEPAAAWDHARTVVQADLDDPERASAGFEGFLGPTTFDAAVDRFLCTDLVIHRWDLAQATGQQVRLDPSDLAHVREVMAPLAHVMRGPNTFGPEVDAPDGADEQTAFLAYFGRRA